MFAKGRGHCFTLFKVTEILSPVNIFKYILKPLGPFKPILYTVSLGQADESLFKCSHDQGGCHAHIW